MKQILISIAMTVTVFLVGCSMSGNLSNMTLKNPQDAVDSINVCNAAEIISEYGAPDSSSEISNITILKYNLTSGGEKQVSFILVDDVVSEITFVENVAFGNTYKSKSSCK